MKVTTTHVRWEFTTGASIDLSTCNTSCPGVAMSISDGEETIRIAMSGEEAERLSESLADAAATAKEWGA